MNPKLIFFTLSVLIISCKNREHSIKSTFLVPEDVHQYITVLGIAQDGGYPHINNTDEFSAVRNGVFQKELVVSLGVIDIARKKKFLFEATPDLPEQLAILEEKHLQNDGIIDGVFLTHAHMGHYTG